MELSSCSYEYNTCTCSIERERLVDLTALAKLMYNVHVHVSCTRQTYMYLWAVLRPINTGAYNVHVQFLIPAGYTSFTILAQIIQGLKPVPDQTSLLKEVLT